MEAEFEKMNVESRKDIEEINKTLEEKVKVIIMHNLNIHNA